mmetsp:Transcript_1850/g.4006  ORF Transcript_1850/g.4006 Transcript_1850/m.4006 type:complete len:243 (+) Transcript_1850:759-1487(+)
MLLELELRRLLSSLSHVRGMHGREFLPQVFLPCFKATNAPLLVRKLCLQRALPRSRCALLFFEAILHIVFRGLRHLGLFTGGVSQPGPILGSPKSCGLLRRGLLRLAQLLFFGVYLDALVGHFVLEFCLMKAPLSFFCTNCTTRALELLAQRRNDRVMLLRHNHGRTNLCFKLRCPAAFDGKCCLRVICLLRQTFTQLMLLERRGFFLVREGLLHLKAPTDGLGQMTPQHSGLLPLAGQTPL